MRYKSGFVIAAVSSGSGKTTVTNGLLRAFKNRGFKVAPFKTGPDFIDTQFHKVASGMESVNLDVFMSDEQHVKSLFQRYSAGSDVRIVEGVMGLFDGYDKRKGSAAHIAELTGLPVVLVINAASSAYSLAAVLSGFKNFDKRIKIAGVIFNNVASENHQRLLKSAAEDAGVTLLGCLKRNPYMTMPSRHLGLSLGDDNVIESFIDRASDAVKVGIDLDLLLSLTQIDKDEKSDDTHVADKCHLISCPSRKIALAYDEAFNFVYTENLRLLEQNLRFGGEIIKFSPLRDRRMPDADFLYLPGGYPELYAARLTANVSMRESIKDYIDRGGYAFAECGGMLYLCDSIDGYEMCGLLPIKATMDNAHLYLGYRIVKTENFAIRGHEFHYSSVIEDGTRIKDYIYPARQYDVNGKEVNTPLYRYKNAIAGYTHMYWGNNDINGLYEDLHT